MSGCWLLSRVNLSPHRILASTGADRALIAWLRKDMRLPVTTLAACLGVSRGTVANGL